MLIEQKERFGEHQPRVALSRTHLQELAQRRDRGFVFPQLVVART